MVNSKSGTKLNPPCDLNKQTVPSPSKDPDARVCALFANEPLKEFTYETTKTIYDTIRHGKNVSNNGPCLGYRENDQAKEYKWISYSSTIARAEALGAALIEIGLKPGQETTVGIYSKNRVEWVLLEHACYCYDLITVPLYDTLGDEAVQYILKLTDIQLALVEEADKAKRLIDNLANDAKLKHLVALFEVDNELRQSAVAKNVQIHSFLELESLGAGLKTRASQQVPKQDSIATICFTSGTTGMPKGAIMTHRNICAAVATISMIKNASIGPGDVYLSFLPLAHMFERLLHCGIYTFGACIGFYSGDVRKLIDDFGILRPHIAAVVPRVLNRIYSTVQQQVSANLIKKGIYKLAIYSKSKDLNKSIINNNTMWDSLVFNKVRAKMGGRLKCVFTGAAPISADVLTFTRAAFGCSVMEGYGQTECAAACTLTLEGDHVPGHVGVPAPCLEIKLVDVIDMGYLAKENKGEVCVRGHSVFPGYWKDEEKTKETLDKYGWLHTGDIGEWTDRGTLRIIDRKKALTKLAQGEYVSPEKIESIYSQCHLVHQCFVYGESLKTCLVAVVVPEIAEVKKVASSEFGLENIDDNELIKKDVVKKYMLDAMNKIAKKKNLFSFEQVKDIYITLEPFSAEADLLTPTMKLKRPQLKKHFEKPISKMYEKLE